MPVPTELHAWLEEKVEGHRWASVIAPRRVSHEWSRSTGGRIMKAALAVSIAPAAGFSLRHAESTHVEYVAAINNGVLSVLLSQSFAPVLGCSLVVESVAVDPVHSCYAAFYEAAKEATQ